MDQEPINYAIVGLGNPGKVYQQSRHNIGFLVIDYLTKQLDVSKDRIECSSLVRLASGPTGKTMLLIKPATFMNNSGQAVAQILQKYALPVAQLLVLQDDLDLPLSQIRFKRRGQSGGHRGIDSIIDYLHTDHFTRLKIGIGRPVFTNDTVEYVLSSFTKVEWKTVQEELPIVMEAIELWIDQGFHVAANRYNRKIQTEYE